MCARAKTACVRACVRAFASFCLCACVFNHTNHQLTPHTHTKHSSCTHVCQHTRAHARTRALYPIPPPQKHTQDSTQDAIQSIQTILTGATTHKRTHTHTRTHKHRGMQTILTGLPRNHSPLLSYSCSRNPLMRHLKRKRKQKRRRVVFACACVHSCVCMRECCLLVLNLVSSTLAQVHTCIHCSSFHTRTIAQMMMKRTMMVRCHPLPPLQPPSALKSRARRNHGMSFVCSSVSILGSSVFFLKK